MLALAAALGALRAPSEPARALVPQRTPARAPVRLCLGWAAHVKTATCNIECNADPFGSVCAAACMCMRTSGVSTAPGVKRSLAMRSEDFARLSALLQPALVRPVIPSEAQQPSRINVTVPALPHEMAGFCAPLPVRAPALVECELADVFASQT